MADRSRAGLAPPTRAAIGVERFAIGVASALTALHALRAFQAAVSDDAFILYRYARHVADGHGLVWNIGEPPIEGFTSLLHVLLLALGRYLGLDLLTTGQLLGVGGAMLSCVAAACVGRRMSGGDARVGVVTAVIVALSPSLAAWARGGMETTLFTALLAFAMASWIGGGRRVAAVLFLAATLSRPEALGIAALTFAFDILDRRDPAAFPLHRRVLGWWPYTAGLLVFLAWKAVVFGALLPNTYHAKSGGGLAALGAGTIYVLGFLRDYGATGLLLAVVPLLLLKEARSRRVTYVATCLAAYCVHVARVGGDYQYFSRYLVPVLPLVAALTAYGAVLAWDATRAHAPRRRLAAALVVVAVATLQLTLPSLRELRDRPWLLVRPFALAADTDPETYSRDFELMGRALRDITRPDETIAAVAVGALGYYSQRPILDLLGLNDRVIARLPLESPPTRWLPGHMRGNAAETLRRRPDVIVLPVRPTATPFASPPAREQASYPFVATLLASSEFRTTYVQEAYPLPDGRWLNVYRRRDTGAGDVAADRYEIATPPAEATDPAR